MDAIGSLTAVAIPTYWKLHRIRSVVQVAVEPVFSTILSTKWRFSQLNRRLNQLNHRLALPTARASQCTAAIVN